MTNPPPFPTTPPRQGLGPGAIIAIVLGGVLLVTLVCGGGLVAIMLPALGAARDSARQTRSMAHLKMVHAGLMSYAAENNGLLPEGDASLPDRLSAYTPAEAFVSPNPPPAGPSYFYVPVGDISKLPDPGATVLIYESPDIKSRGGWNVLYADGSVRSIVGPSYRMLIDGLRLPDGTPWTPHLGK